MSSAAERASSHHAITGEYIKKLRTERGLSQTELANLAGISQAHIAKIESGKVDPRLSTVNKILLVLSEKEKASKRCGDIMSRVMSVRPDIPARKVAVLMKSSGFSQVPVMHAGVQLGSISEETLLRNMDRNLERLQAKDIMDNPFPVVDVGETIEILPSLLDAHPAVLVSEKGRVRGIITKSDLLAIK
jgi:predicted transcriptional regulator